MSFGGEGPTTNTNSSNISNTSGTSTSAESVQQTLPDWFLTEWQNLLGQGNWLNQNLQTPVAGLTPDQEHSSWLMNAALQGFMNRPNIPAYDVFGMGAELGSGATDRPRRRRLPVRSRPI